MKLFTQLLLSATLIAGAAQAQTTTWRAATSIAAGDEVLLVYTPESVEMSGISTTSTKYGTSAAYTATPAGLFPLTVEAGTTAGTYAFKTVDGDYLYWASGNSLNVDVTPSTNTDWMVTIDPATNEATIENCAQAGRSIRYNTSAPRFACYGATSSVTTHVTLFKNASASGSGTTVTAPVISPASGTFFEDVTISIAGEPNASIYYTTDGSTPDNTTLLYDAPFTLPYEAGAVIPVKAIAYDAQGNSSDVSTSTITFGDATSGYTSVADLFAAATKTSAPVTVTMDNWVVNGTHDNATGTTITAYVVDQYGDGFQIYNSAGVGFVEGDHLSGTVAADLLIYSGACELMSIDANTPGLTVTPGAPMEAVETDLGQITSPLRMGNMVTLNNLTWDGTQFADTLGRTIAYYDGTFGAGISFVQGTIYNVTGMINYYNKMQICVKSTDDYEVIGMEGGAVAAPVITPGTGTFPEAQSVTISAVDGCTIYYTLDGSTPDSTSILYTAPIEVTETTTIKAIAYDAEGTASAISVAYITINPNATGISLPVESAIPAGFYNDLEGLSGQALKMAVYQADYQHTNLTYNGLWPAYEVADVFFYTEDMVVDYYNDQEFHFTGTGWSPSGMNREHVCARSWWGSTDSSTTPHNDLFQVLPSESSANSAKSNYPLGKAASATYANTRMTVGPSAVAGYTGQVFEPCDEYKGDFARIFLYVATIYYNAPWGSNTNVLPTVPFVQEEYPTIKDWILPVLLEWNAQDPVSQWEVTRNERAFSLQGNRNPFIDYPQLADHIWGDQKEVPFSLSTAVINGTTEPKALGLLYPASVSGIDAVAIESGIEEAGAPCFNVLGQPVRSNARGLIIRSDGRKMIIR